MNFLFGAYNQIKEFLTNPVQDDDGRIGIRIEGQSQVHGVGRIRTEGQSPAYGGSGIRTEDQCPAYGGSGIRTEDQCPAYGGSGIRTEDQSPAYGGSGIRTEDQCPANGGCGIKTDDGDSESSIITYTEQQCAEMIMPLEHEEFESSHTGGEDIEDIQRAFNENNQVQDEGASAEDNNKQTSYVDYRKKYFEEEIPKPHRLDLSNYTPLGVGRLASINPMSSLVSGYRWDTNRFASQYDLNRSRSNLKKVPSGYLQFQREMPIRETETHWNDLSLKLILGKISQLGNAEAALIFWKKEEIFKTEVLLQKSMFKNAEPKTHIEFRKLRSKLISKGFLEMESGGSRQVKKFMHFVMDSSIQQTVCNALKETVHLQNVLIPLVKSDSLADNCSDIVHGVYEHSKSCNQTTVTILTDQDFLYETLTMCISRLEDEGDADYDTFSDTSDSVSSLDDVKESFSYVTINYQCRYYLDKNSNLISEHSSSEILRFRGEECMKLRYVIGTDVGQKRLKLKIKSMGDTHLEFKFINGKDQIYVESSHILQGDTELDFWKVSVKSTLKNQIYKIQAYPVFTESDIYKTVLEELQKLRGTQNRQIITLTESSDNHIWIVGHSTSANRALHRAQTIIKDIRKARERTTLTLQFSKGQMGVLKGSEFFQSILRKYSRLEVLEEDDALTITGMLDDTEKVKGQIKTWMKRLVTFDIQPDDKSILCLLRHLETQNYVTDSYFKNQIHCALEIRESENKLFLCVEYADHIDTETVNKLFQECIFHYAYREGNVGKLIKLKWWARKRSELLEKFQGKLHIQSEKETQSIIVNCTDDIKGEVTNIIKQALEHLDFEKTIKVSRDISKYLWKCREDEILELQYKHDVDISYNFSVGKCYNSSISIKGIQYEVEEVYVVLKYVISLVDSCKHLCTQPAAVSYFLKSERYVDSLKKKMNCIIKTEKIPRSSTNETWNFNGCSVSILSQDSTDAVVVYPVEHSTRKHEKLKNFTMSLGNLKTPMVHHLYPKWKDNDVKGEIKTKMAKSLRYLIANQFGCRSIAFPIELYNLWPLKTLVEIILFSVKHCMQENDTLMLNAIIICKNKLNYQMIVKKVQTFMDTEILKGIKQRRRRSQTLDTDICFTITAKREDIKVIKENIENKCLRIQAKNDERNSMHPSSDSDSFAEVSPTSKTTQGRQLFEGLPVQGIRAGIAVSGVKYRDKISDFVSGKLQRPRSMPGINSDKGLDFADEAICEQDKCSGYDLRKRYDTTMYVSLLEVFFKDYGKSVGHITIACGNGTVYCTGFRAGVDYVISTYHSFKEILDMSSRWSWQQIDHFWSNAIFIKFGFKREIERDSIVKFFFSPQVCFFNPELDVIVLKLKPCGNHFPRPFQLSQNDHSSSKISFYGHPNGEPLIIDPGCHAQDLADDIIKQAKHFAQINFSNCPNAYNNVDNQKFSLYHCYFQVGGSGAPGVINEPNFNIIVNCMLLRGFPSFFPNLSKDDQEKYPRKFMFEQCLPMATLYKDLKQKQPNLCDELFTDNRQIENMEV